MDLDLCNRLLSLLDYGEYYKVKKLIARTLDWYVDGGEEVITVFSFTADDLRTFIQCMQAPLAPKYLVVTSPCIIC